MPKTVMVILNYNDSKVAQKLVESVKAFSCPDRVVVVDNRSTDGSFEYLRDAFSGDERVDVIESPDNGGYAKGNNFGIKYAIDSYDPEYIFVANPDIAVTEETLKALVAAMEADNSYAVMAPLVSKGYNVWNIPGFAGMIESLFLVWFTLDKKRIRRNLVDSGRKVCDAGVVEGSFFALRAEDYKRIEGFDERTFLYAEEIILARRLEKIGRKIGVLTDERYDHLHSASIRKHYNASKRRAFPNFYRSFCIYNKYYLGTNKLQDAVFAVCYGLAYVERFFYDVIRKVTG